MKIKFLIGIFSVLLGVIGVALVLASDHAVVFHPKGIIARDILELILFNTFLMLLIILPTYILLFAVVWKFCIKKEIIHNNPNDSAGAGPFAVWMMWTLPSIIVVVMAIVTWKATHQLNPYKPIHSENEPLTVQVIALNWKWLFIYPELGIAALNTLHIPERTPIHLKLTADAAPMNSFWIPQLSGQIYSMTGMTTQLNIMADKTGEYVGRGAEINGEGYSGMTFLTKSTNQKKFEEWVEQVKQSQQHLDDDTYRQLVQPAINQSIILFSNVKKNLFDEVIQQYMYPKESVL